MFSILERRLVCVEINVEIELPKQKESLLDDEKREKRLAYMMVRKQVTHRERSV